MPRLRNLSTKLGLSAASIVLTTLLAVGFLIFGLGQVSRELQVAEMAETQIENYSALAAQIDAFAISSMTDTAPSAGERAARLAKFRDPVDRIFAAIRDTLSTSVAAALDLGSDEQTSRATQGLTVARMEAQFSHLFARISAEQGGAESIMLHLNAFSTQMTPLLTGAIGEEKRRRDLALSEIRMLRSRLNLYGILIAVGSVCLLIGYYFGLIRPQFLRLSRLEFATRQIGHEDFAIDLPAARDDEIGRIVTEIKATSAKLSARRDAINIDQQRLKDVIDARTIELQKANAALKRRDLDRRRFFADISHEMRTPLTVILTEAELAQSADTQTATAFDVIRNRVLRLNRRVDDLLRIAQSDTGHISLDKQVFSLDQAAREAIDETETQVRRAGMTIDRDLRHADAFGDPNWTRQIIAGLIDNAVRHSGGDRIAVEIATAKKTSRVTVRDNGSGFRENAVPFERFAKNETSAGFGIGLSLAKWIVEKQGGLIQIGDDDKSVVVTLPSLAVEGEECLKKS